MLRLSRVRTALVLVGLAAACLMSGYALGRRDALSFAQLGPRPPAPVSAEQQRAFSLKITVFSELASQQLREQLPPLLAQGSKAVVLDLRGNPGGYLTSAVDVTSDFLKDGIVLYQDRGGADGMRQPYHATGNPQAPDLPVAVLVDRGSASAAEIVAAALRDNQRAVLFGEKTFGKGTVQEVHKLSDASQLRVTVARWLTPDGHAIQGEGLLPDVVAPTAEGRDAPLDAAVGYLRRGSADG